MLITGASRGIGLAVAERLARQGHRPISLARTSTDAFPGDFHEVDLSDRAATDTALRAALAHGPVDAVVNNVGLVRPASVHEADLDDLYAVYDVTVRVAVQVVQAALPAMTAHGWGRIVSITSLVTVGRPERTAYGAAALPHPEIASAVLYLASEAASAVRGVLLPVDGGRTAV
ncbi:SDR family NAD(P)-dependent oxidoreductase [Streptomyces erythrogriseus]|uniref:Short-chain dehydrogenase n=1 Tax=Streptomyces erythrogriseus TaxID=284027 RepID=A0ABN3XGQ5_9ACTN